VEFRNARTLNVNVAKIPMNMVCESMVAIASASRALQALAFALAAESALARKSGVTER